MQKHAPICLLLWDTAAVQQEIDCQSRTYSYSTAADHQGFDINIEVWWAKTHDADAWL